LLLECARCSNCGSHNIKRRNRIRRKTVDMRFSNGGVKKWIVSYRSWSYKCEDCETRFKPENWPGDHALYQPRLACWCVYQNVECKQSMGQVRATLADVFSLNVARNELYKFKTWIAERYGSLYDKIKVAILKGHLIHIDEATVNLKNNEKGYVWVITSLDK